MRKIAVLVCLLMLAVPVLAGAKLSVGVQASRFDNGLTDKTAWGYCVDKTWQVYGNYGVLTGYSSAKVSEGDAELTLKTYSLGLLKQKEINLGWFTLSPKIAYVDVKMKRTPVGADFWTLSQYGIDERFVSPGVAVGFIPKASKHFGFEVGYQWIDSKDLLKANLSPITAGVKLILW